ncbi:MAG: type II toxin-antitoxin system RelE/ParE family toxin [Candidatus Anammoxibacter sp.]
MGFKVEVSHDAIEDLINIVRYIAQDNPKNAEEYGYLLLDRTDELETQPEMGRKVLIG